MARAVATLAHRLASGFLFIALAALLLPRAAHAQAPQVDPRWNAWIGCWSTAQVASGNSARAVCVVPAAGASAIDLTTLDANGVLSRERIETNGEHRASERDGCTGWESAKWAADGRRLYLQSEHQCASGVKRSSQGLMAISRQGDWLDVVSVTMGENTGVRVLRHRPIVTPAALPAEQAAALKAMPSARGVEARTLASAPIGPGDIIEASHQVNGSVVAAWLNDIRQDIGMDAKRLVQLADAGVSDRVIDMLVALAYPGAFDVPPSPTSAGSLASSGGGGGGGGLVDFGGGFADVGGYSPLGCASDFSVFGWDRCAPFAYAPFGLFSAAYLPFAFSQYGYGSNIYSAYGPYSPYGGWYTGAPVVVIRGNDTPHGQVVNGRGYTSNPGGSTSTASSSGGSSGGGSVSTASAPSSGGGGASAGGGGGGGGDRTAHPR